MANPIHAATSLFTIIPVPCIEIDTPTARKAIMALPWVGLFLGALAAAAAVGVSVAGGGAVLAALIGLAVLVVLTGALHQDGLADTFDGLGSRRDAEGALAIMKQSDIGPMGVVSLIFSVGLNVAALSSPRLNLFGLAFVLLAAPMVARVTDLAACGPWARSARPGGFGALFAGVVPVRAIVVNTLVIFVLTAGLAFYAGRERGLVVALIAVCVSWLVSWLWWRHLTRRLGGITGDVFGSLIEVSFVTFTLVCALGW